MTRARGRCAKGERLHVAIPHGHWITTPLVCCMGIRAMVAPLVLDGPINRDAFLAYVEQFLVPVLKPGDILIMDNLSTHKGDTIRNLIEAAGAQLRFLPPYSPDLNPIKTPFRNSRLASRKSLQELSPNSGMQSQKSCRKSRKPIAETSSSMPDTNQHDRKTT